MPRFAKKIDQVELRRAIYDKIVAGEEFLDDWDDSVLPGAEYSDPEKLDWSNFMNCAHEWLHNFKEKELTKVDFDFENIMFMDPSVDPHSKFYTIDGLTFALICAGGDWEHPIYFAVYMDPKNVLRGYIPKNGNCYNHKTKAAFGNADEDDDNAEAQRLYGSDWYDLGYKDPDISALLDDITKRIEVKEV